MKAYRKFIRAKKGISTVFAGLFFVILILMGFNVMTWEFLQYDTYNGVVTSMSQRDQQSLSESLAATAPGATGFVGNSFNIIMNNTGSVMVTVSRIYISNFSPTGSTKCSGSNICIIDPVSPSNCAGKGNCIFTNANVLVGENNHSIHVSGLTINDGSGYKVVLSSSRGRQFSFYYPWPVNIFGPAGASNSNVTDTAHGPLDIKLAANSFNFTQGTQTTSQPAWNIPYRVNVVFWIKVYNNAIYPITLSKYTNLYLFCEPPGADCENTQTYFISDNQTINPSSIVAYDEVNRPVVVPAAGSNGPTGFTVIKFGSFNPASTTAEALSEATPYLFFMMFFFKLNGVVVGQTLNFFAIRACTTYPSCP